MSDNPFSSKPTIVDEVEDEQDDEQQDDPIPQEVQEDYDRVSSEGNEVEDDEGEADEEWAQTPVGLFGSVDQEKFWWVFVTLEEQFVESGGQTALDEEPDDAVEEKDVPVVQERFDSYDDLVEAREEADEAIPGGIHVQLRESNKIRYVKGDDEQKLLELRDLE